MESWWWLAFESFGGELTQGRSFSPQAGVTDPKPPSAAIPAAGFRPGSSRQHPGRASFEPGGAAQVPLGGTRPAPREPGQGPEHGPGGSGHAGNR